MFRLRQLTTLYLFPWRRSNPVQEETEKKRERTKERGIELRMTHPFLGFLSATVTICCIEPNQPINSSLIITATKNQACHRSSLLSTVVAG